MSDTNLYSLIQDVQDNGIRAVTIFGIYTLYSKERRNHQLNQRDAALFHNLKILMEERGLGSEWKDGPRIGIQLDRLPNFKQLLILLSKATFQKKSNYPRRKNMNALKSTKFWLAIIGAIVPVINSEVGLHLDPTTILGILGLFATAIAGIAHVDAKKAQNITTQDTPTQNGGMPNVDAQPKGDSGAAV